MSLCCCSLAGTAACKTCPNNPAADLSKVRTTITTTSTGGDYTTISYPDNGKIETIQSRETNIDTPFVTGTELTTETACKLERLLDKTEDETIRELIKILIDKEKSYIRRAGL